MDIEGNTSLRGEKAVPPRRGALPIAEGNDCHRGEKGLSSR